MTTKHTGKMPFPTTLLALVLLSGLGCVHEPPVPQEQQWQAAVPPPAAPRPVTADDVNAQNSRAMVQALRDELARENGQVR